MAENAVTSHDGEPAGGMNEVPPTIERPPRFKGAFTAFSVMFLVDLFLLVKVVPVFATVFSDFGGDLPKPTQMLINVSAAIQGLGFFLIPASILDLFGAYFLFRLAASRSRAAILVMVGVVGALPIPIIIAMFAPIFSMGTGLVSG